MKRTRFKPRWNGKLTEVSCGYFRDYASEISHRYYVPEWELLSNFKYTRNYPIFCDNYNEPLKRTKYRRDFDKVVSILKEHYEV